MVTAVRRDRASPDLRGRSRISPSVFMRACPFQQGMVPELTGSSDSFVNPIRVMGFKWGDAMKLFGTGCGTARLFAASPVSPEPKMLAPSRRLRLAFSGLAKRRLAGMSLVAALLAGQVQAASTALVLEPSSPWSMDYAEDSCRLARIFGTGDQSVFFYIERFAPSTEQFVVVAGKPLSRYEKKPVGLRFSPDAPLRESTIFWGTHGSFAPAVIAPTVDLVEKPAGEPSTDSLFAVVSPEREKSINAFEVMTGKNVAVRLNVGSMGAAFEAMRKCTDELVTHWGLDVEVHRTLTSRAIPRTSPGKWVTNDDYPSEALRKGAQGVVPFRLIVGADGVPTDCLVQRPTEPANFNEIACKLLMKRARFEPALDSTGKPVKSYYSSTFSFIISG